MADNAGGVSGIGGLSWDTIADWASKSALGAALVGLAKLAIDKLFPSGSERLADRAKRRVEHADRVRALESEVDDLRRELEASSLARLAEREAHIETKGRLVTSNNELESLRRSIERPVVTVPAGTVVVQPLPEAPGILQDGQPIEPRDHSADGTHQRRDEHGTNGNAG